MKFSKHIVIPLSLICIALLTGYALLNDRTLSRSSSIESKAASRKTPALLTPTTLPANTYDLAIINNDEVWAVGLDNRDSRRMWHSIDYGHTWQVVIAPTDGWVLESIYFTDKDHGWAVGSHNLMIRTADGGRSWEQIKLPVEGAVNKVLFLNPSIGFAAASTGYYDKKANISVHGIELLCTDDGGDTWRSCYKDNKSSDVFGMVALSEQIIVVSLNGSQLLRTEDRGKTWQTVVTLDRSSSKPTFNSVAFASNGVGWAVGNEGIFYHSVDQGRTWQQAENLPPSFSRKQWASIAFADTQKGVAVAEDGTVALTDNAGQTWSESETKAEGRPYKIKLHGDTGIILGRDKNYMVKLNALP
jgi:photosystem II stability/assembly factor-like uncharacterized protein